MACLCSTLKRWWAVNGLPGRYLNYNKNLSTYKKHICSMLICIIKTFTEFNYARRSRMSQ